MKRTSLLIFATLVLLSMLSCSRTGSRRIKAETTILMYLSCRITVSGTTEMITALRKWVLLKNKY